jgi:hypothetical protein
MTRIGCVIILIASSLAAGLESASPGAEGVPRNGSIVVHDDFEQWSWQPITFSMRKEGRKRLQEGKPLSYEYRGPLYRIPKGFVLPAGRMVEGDEAFEGRSVLLENCQVGLHGRYSKIISPGKSYRYRVTLKGKGTFHFRAWVGGTNPSTGEFRWLGFPDLITVKVTDSWKTYDGTFQLPQFDTTTFKLPRKVSAAIVVQEGYRVYVDNFAISEPD